MSRNFYKSNFGLGHREYVYLINIGDARYVILNTIGFYKAGHIEKFDYFEIEVCSEDEVEFN